MEVGDGFRSMFQLGSEEPSVFFISPLVAHLSNVVEELTLTSSPVQLQVYNLGYFILEITFDFNQRRQRSGAT